MKGQSMRRYASSGFRLVLLAVLIAAAGTVMGQAPAGAPTPPAADAPRAAQGLFQLIGENLDFVFFTIFVLSIIGLTLIIQGFIKNRASVLMPENTTQLIREMIAQRRFKELMDFT